ncbi:MAG: hypothetical protein C0600_08835 [Ignavibacteria bacterium]|nr:MAG: hypothetical protein C0600_08835 [Ignavibacteria bacterium]
MNGVADAYISVFNSSGVPEYSTYYGGSGTDAGVAGSYDNNGKLVVAGITRSSNFPVVNPQQASYAGDWDGFLMNLSGGAPVVLPPNAPSDLTATPVSPTRVRLDWQDNSDNENIFEIEHKTAGSQWSPLSNVMANTSTWTVMDLAPQTVHRFRVRAVNSLYQSDYSDSASALTPPFNAPTGLTADSISFSTLVLNWQDLSTNEDEFIVEQSDDGTSWTEVKTVAKNITISRVTGLSPQTEYHFRVYAKDGPISSGYSNILIVSTLALVSPDNLTATALSSEEIQLDWTDQTSSEEGFIVEYRKTGDSWLTVDSAAANSDSYLVGGLLPSTTYEFRVCAYTTSILSPYSNVAQATTLLFLDAPTNLVGMLMSETNVVLSWEDHSDGEAGFEIEYKEGSGAWTLLHTTVAHVTTYDAQGLTPCTINHFRVRAVGNQATSGHSNTVTIETCMPPATPQNLLATAVDHTSIRIIWQRGSENEDGYEVERSEDASDWELLTTTGPGNGDILDENLPIMTTFWYRVRAKNNKGESTWSNADSATTWDIPIPSAPFGLRASATGQNSINLVWEMPSTSTVEAFEIEMSPTGDPGSFSYLPPSAEGSKRVHEVHNLQTDTEYYFRIRAVNRSGPSPYSNTADARTSRSELPSVPHNVMAIALSDSKIELTWEMPDPSNEDGFELQRSLTGDEGDFTALSPEPAQGGRTYTDTGLTTGTTYYYRLRSYNSFGQSAWTDTVSATTQKEVIAPELRAAMDAKRQVISQVETLIPGGTPELNTLRTMLGDYTRGYDESSATILIGEWTAGGASDAAQATQAMKRFTLFEETLRDSWGDDDVIPTVTGAQDLGSQCARIPAIATKDLIALALAWKDERDYLGADDPHVNAAMEDMILALSDNTRQLLSLMGADQGSELSALTDDIIRGSGEIDGLEAALMLSLTEYWQQHMLGRYYLPVTQPLIAEYAERTEQVDYAGTKSEAEGKRDAYLTQFRADIDALSMDFSDYYRIGTSLDKAYAIGQAPGAGTDIFLMRIMGLRPPLTDNMYAALADAIIPTERFLYMTSTDAVPELGSVPSALREAGEAIFDPTQGGIVQQENSLSVFRKSAATIANPVIDADFALLQELRSNVQAGDTQYIEAEFDALRRSGKDLVAEVDRLQRPLLGVDRAQLYQDETLRGDYYYTLARLQLLKTRRTVLSVALAEYVANPAASKQTALVAEIDSIIGPFSDAQDVLTNLTSDVGSITLIPALSLENADIVRDEASGPTRCRIHFEVKNVGGADAETPAAELSFLSDGVGAVDSTGYSFTTLQPDGSVRDSLDVTIDAGITHVTISMTMETGGRVFIDRRTLQVPDTTTTTAVEQKHPLPASCILHQNYPNPFNPATTITYELPGSMRVSLVVTDALGREVWRAGSRKQEAGGRHSVIFDASALPSGVYLYRLETEDAVLVRKMVVMK